MITSSRIVLESFSPDHTFLCLFQTDNFDTNGNINLESTLNSRSLSLNSMFCRQKCQALTLPHQVLSNEKYFLLIRTPKEKKKTTTAYTSCVACFSRGFLKNSEHIQDLACGRHFESFNATLFENSVKSSRTESYSEITTFYLKDKI